MTGMFKSAPTAEVGTVDSFAQATPPAGWLECNGATVSRTAYAALFAKIGTTWGAGDGATTFAVPDLRGEFIRGWDNGRGVDNGRAFATAQADELKAHAHDVQKSSSDADGSTFSPGSGSFGVQATSTTGGTETRPRNVAMLFCIKF